MKRSREVSSTSLESLTPGQMIKGKQAGCIVGRILFYK